MKGQYCIKIYSPYVLNENQKNQIKTLIKIELLEWFGDENTTELKSVEFKFEKLNF
ncbi:hypothetical protein [Campylobacter sp. US33a]|uniref:hypothetical protein n=1 Tax=Campylobacter sp. US33a TaxID=2498120 RepID=UPI001419C293|nr:hypothetical protein [Campylobacter sp. US33a]